MNKSFWILPFLALVANATVTTIHSDLRKFILNDYDKEVNPDSMVIVSVMMNLLDIHIDEKNHGLLETFTGFIWNDPRLTWNQEDFNNIERIRLNSKLVWIPDISLYGGEAKVLNGLPMDHGDYNVLVYSNGTVIYVPPMGYEAKCTPTKCPFAKRNCTVKMGSWTFDKTSVDVQIATDKDITLDHFYSTEFEVTSFDAIREEKTYPCCPDELYPSITFTVEVKPKDASHA